MPRRGENIYKRRDGRWEGRYRQGYKENGRAHYGSVYGKSYAEVKKKLDACRAKQYKAPILNSALTVKNLFQKWLEIRTAKVKQSSLARYNELIQKHILPELGALQVCSLTVEKLEAFLSSKLQNGRLDGKGGLSPKTVCDIAAVIKSALKLAENINAFCNTAVFEVKAPACKQHRADTFGEYEAARMTELLFSSSDISSVAYLLCLNTGIRLGELCALRWSDIDPMEQSLHIRRTVQRIRTGHGTKLVIQTPKSDASERIIPLTPELLSMLKRVREHAPADSYMLTGRLDKPMEPRTMQYRFQSFLNKNGFRLRNFHVLRHTFATRCISSGADPKSLSEILGHANVKTTLQLYVHPSMEQKRAYIQSASTVRAMKATCA